MGKYDKASLPDSTTPKTVEDPPDLAGYRMSLVFNQSSYGLCHSQPADRI